MKKYGIFGGTFNPIHYGHLMICEYLKEELGLDKIIFIPTGNPPHKDLDVSARARYEMVKLAISSNPTFEISDIETNRIKLSYTVDTVRDLKKIYKDEKLFFLIGLDTLFQLKTWKKIEELSGEIEFVVALRPKYIDIKEINRELKFLRENYGTKVEIIHTPLYEISSTELRDRIKEEKSVRYLIPEEVVNYIKEASKKKSILEIKREYSLKNIIKKLLISSPLIVLFTILGSLYYNLLSIPPILTCLIGSSLLSINLINQINNYVNARKVLNEYNDLTKTNNISENITDLNNEIDINIKNIYINRQYEFDVELLNGILENDYLGKENSHNYEENNENLTYTTMPKLKIYKK